MRRVEVTSGWSTASWPLVALDLEAPSTAGEQRRRVERASTGNAVGIRQNNRHGFCLTDVRNSAIAIVEPVCGTAGWCAAIGVSAADTYARAGAAAGGVSLATTAFGLFYP